METNNPRFAIIPALLKELEQEAATTRRMLALVPFDQHSWQPHPKSMSLGALATHLAEVPAWIDMALHTEGWDMGATPYVATVVNSNNELLEVFEAAYAKGHAALAAAQEADLLGTWTMRSGEYIISAMTKYETIRHAFSQTCHHRAQLGVFLRLNHIPIPGSYGPSADESYGRM